jgi:hypothetical protein
MKRFFYLKKFLIILVTLFSAGTPENSTRYKREINHEIRFHDIRLRGATKFLSAADIQEIKYGVESLPNVDHRLVEIQVWADPAPPSISGAARQVGGSSENEPKLSATVQTGVAPSQMGDGSYLLFFEKNNDHWEVKKDVQKIRWHDPPSPNLRASLDKYIIDSVIGQRQ